MAQHQLAGGETIEVAGSRRFRNFLQEGDVNNSGTVTTGDALEVIFELNRRLVSNANGDLANPATVTPWLEICLDVNGDGRATAADALAVINILFRQSLSSGEGESVAQASLLSFSQILPIKPLENREPVDVEATVLDTRAHMMKKLVKSSVQSSAAHQLVAIDDIMRERETKHEPDVGLGQHQQ